MKATSFNPSYSTGIRLFSPTVIKSKPLSVLVFQAMTALPGQILSITVSQIISRTRWLISPTYTPALTSSSQSASLPRRAGGAFSSTITVIANPFRLGKCGANRFGWGLGRFDFAGRKHLFDQWNEYGQNLFLAKHIATGQTHLPFRVERLFGSDLESDGNDGIEFQYIGYIVNERERFSRMDKPYRRCVSGRQYRRLGDAVQGGRSGTETAVDFVRRVPLFRIVSSALP